jgi:hypothetical protein
VTLAITIAAPWGIFQASDHRLTHWPSGRLVDDHSVKHVGLRSTDGGMLLTYTGLGLIGTSHVSDWVRGTLRGESRTVDESLIHLRQRATARLGLISAKAGIHHAFCVGCFLRNEPWAVVIANTESDNGKPDFSRPPTSTFETYAFRAGNGFAIIAGGGVAAMSAEDLAFVQKIAHLPPRNASDYRQALANVIRRSANSKRLGHETISETSLTAYMPPQLDGVRSEWHWWGQASPPVDTPVPFLLFGIDTTDITRHLLKKAAATQLGKGSPSGPDWQQTVTPDDKVR